MSAKRDESVKAKAQSDGDGVKSRIKRMQELLKHADDELKGMETDYRSATEKLDEELRHYQSTIFNVYEDVRALTIQCISDQSKIPQREAEDFSIYAKANEISSMVSLLKSEMAMLSRKLKDAEQEMKKQQERNRAIAHIKSMQDQRIKELESRNKELEESRKEISKMSSLKDYEIEALKSKQKQINDKLDKSNAALKNEIEVTTKYNSMLNDAYTEIKQLRTTNQVSSYPAMLEELQRKLAVNESQLEHERSIFERELQDLRRELARAKDRME